MKKLLALLVLFLLPMSTFADLQIGATALYNIRIYDPNEIELSSISLSDFSFGLESRLNISVLQGAAYVLVTPGSINENATGPGDIYLPTKLDVFLDIGICLDLLMFRFGAGIGPNFAINIDYPANPNFEPDVFEAGANIKLTGDIMLGGISLGLVYLMDTNLTKQGVADAFSKWNGRLGVSVLFKLL